METFDCNGKEIKIRMFSGILCGEGPLYPVDVDPIVLSQLTNSLRSPQVVKNYVVDDVDEYFRGLPCVRCLYMGSTYFAENDLYHYWLLFNPKNDYKLSLGVGAIVDNKYILSHRDCYPVSEILYPLLTPILVSGVLVSALDK